MRNLDAGDADGADALLSLAALASESAAASAAAATVRRPSPAKPVPAARRPASSPPPEQTRKRARPAELAPPSPLSAKDQVGVGCAGLLHLGLQSVVYFCPT